MKFIFSGLLLGLGLIVGVGCSDQKSQCETKLLHHYVNFMHLGREANVNQDAIDTVRDALSETLMTCGAGPLEIEHEMLGSITRTELSILSGDQELIQQSLNELLACEGCEREIVESLHFAATYGTPWSIEIFVGRQIDINSRDEFGNTPLISTIGGTQTNLENTKTVVGLGGEVNAVANSGMSALTVAVLEADVDAVEYLLDMGASVTPTGKNDRSVFDLASRVQNQEIISLLGRQE